MSDRDRIIETLLHRHGHTFCEELGIEVGANNPAPLFQSLCLALLFSAPIQASIAVAAMRALIERGWTTARRMAQAEWSDRVEALNRAGYARLDEKTATLLGDAADLLLERYSGDLRQLRNAAGEEPGEERRLLAQVKGIGDVGVDIFFREAQAAWPELYPFADRKALAGAHALGLPDRAGPLARLVEPSAFPRLVAALVRMELAGDAEEIRAAAG